MAVAISPQKIVREEEDVFDVVITTVEEHINKHREPSEGQEHPVDSLDNRFNNNESEEQGDHRRPIIHARNKQIMPRFHH